MFPLFIYQWEFQLQFAYRGKKKRKTFPVYGVTLRIPSRVKLNAARAIWCRGSDNNC